MTTLQPPEVLRDGDITVVVPGVDYENLYENMLPSFAGVRELAQTIEPPKMVFDLSSVKFFGSAFMGFLVELSRRLKDRNGRFAVCGLSPFAAAAMERVGLNQVLTIVGTRAEALAAVRG